MNINFTIQKNGIICPNCMVTYQDQSKLSKFINQIKSLEKNAIYYGSNESVYFSEAQQFSKAVKTDILVKWACDECIGRGKAIIPKDLNFQNRRMGTPIFAYYDEKKKCKLCDTEFIFKGDEHKHWIENLEFFHLATRIYCESCQSEITMHKKLSEYMANLNSANLTPDEIVEHSIKASNLYSELGKNSKAKGVLKVGLNRLKKDNENSAEQIEKLKTEYNNVSIPLS